MADTTRDLSKAWIYSGKTYGPGASVKMSEEVAKALAEKGAFEEERPVFMSAADPMASAAGPLPPGAAAPLPRPVVMPSSFPPAPNLTPTVPVPGVSARDTAALLPDITPEDARAMLEKMRTLEADNARLRQEAEARPVENAPVSPGADAQGGPVGNVAPNTDVPSTGQSGDSGQSSGGQTGTAADSGAHTTTPPDATPPTPSRRAAGRRRVAGEHDSDDPDDTGESGDGKPSE